ncbi:MAG: hypothetical protein ACI4XE_08750 [Acutalibacteraceae bacterium]
MKPYKKILIMVLAVIVLAGAGVFGVRSHRKSNLNRLQTTTYDMPENYSQLPVNYSKYVYAFDPLDLEACVGSADYVFVGKIEKLVGTTYTDASYLENGKLTATPWTNYEVTVIKNIKGDLETGQTIPIRKFGGVAYGEEYLELIQDDTLPTVGETYIFLSDVDEKGELYVSGGAQTVSLFTMEGGNPSMTTKELDTARKETIAEYEKAFQNQNTQYRTYGERVCNYDKEALTAKTDK